MTRATDLSASAVARRRLIEECQPAVRRLKGRAATLERNAGRLPVGHARSKAEAQAKHLRACAALIDSDTEYGDRIRRALQAANAVNAGWERLSYGVTYLARKFRFEFDAEQEALRNPDLDGVKVGEAWQEAKVDLDRRMTEKYGKPKPRF